jgi:protein phosphatase 2C
LQARVVGLGGKVVLKGGSHRIMGLLAMSRAIGDHFLRPFVIPEPETQAIARTAEDELLLLASDGLWDVFSSQEATTLALRSIMRARDRGASAAAACR